VRNNIEGDGRWETEDGRWETEGRRPKTGDGRPKMGDGLQSHSILSISFKDGRRKIGAGFAYSAVHPVQISTERFDRVKTPEEADGRRNLSF
jgi:hypothetical protein